MSDWEQQKKLARELKELVRQRQFDIVIPAQQPPPLHRHRIHRSLLPDRDLPIIIDYFDRIPNRSTS